MKICTIFYRIRMNKAKTILIAVSTVFLFTTSANACLAACKEKKRDEAYSKPLSAATLQTVVDKALPLKAVDPELGEPYQVYPIDVKPYDKDFHATLIEYPFGSSPRTKSILKTAKSVAACVSSSKILISRLRRCALSTSRP